MLKISAKNDSVPAALPQGKSPSYPLDRRLGGPQMVPSDRHLLSRLHDVYSVWFSLYVGISYSESLPLSFFTRTTLDICDSVKSSLISLHFTHGAPPPN
jgi:hypothetical protein